MHFTHCCIFLFSYHFFYFLRSPVFFIKLYVNNGKSNSQLVVSIIISLSLSQAISPRYSLEPTGDLHRPGFNDHTAVLSELYDVPSAAVLCRESVEYLLLLLLLTAAAVVVIVLVGKVDSH